MCELQIGDFWIRGVKRYNKEREEIIIRITTLDHSNYSDDIAGYGTDVLDKVYEGVYYIEATSLFLLDCYKLYH
jgi:hypothetical protein